MSATPLRWASGGSHCEPSHPHPPAGYGFVEFSSEEEMKRAFKRADGMRLEGKRIGEADAARTRSGGGLLPAADSAHHHHAHAHVHPPAP